MIEERRCPLCDAPMSAPWLCDGCWRRLGLASQQEFYRLSQSQGPTAGRLYLLRELSAAERRAS